MIDMWDDPKSFLREIHIEVKWHCRRNIWDWYWRILDAVSGYCRVLWTKKVVWRVASCDEFYREVIEGTDWAVFGSLDTMKVNILLVVVLLSCAVCATSFTMLQVELFLGEDRCIGQGLDENDDALFKMGVSSKSSKASEVSVIATVRAKCGL